MYIFKFGEKTPCYIAGYLLVYPFSFDSLGRLVGKPQEARAFIDLCSSKVQKGNERKRQSKDLPGSGDFVVANEERNIVSLKKFETKFAFTPASLDMSRACWVLRGMDVADVGVEFTPTPIPYAQFGEEEGNNAFWGAEIAEPGGRAVLHASLSAPVYGVDGGEPSVVVEYLALGPANGAGQGGGEDESIFRWLVDRVKAPKMGEAGVHSMPSEALPVLEVRDVVSKQKNNFFGNDDAGRAQVAGTPSAAGAVFLMNGVVLDAPWRTLASVIRRMATEFGEDSAIRFMEQMPVGRLDQSVSETMKQEQRSTAELTTFDTTDFEGIMLWGLKKRTGEPMLPMHR